MADFEIRIGATPDDIKRRTIGISPPLPQNILDRIHEDPESCNLPFIRFGLVRPPDSEPYSEATMWGICLGERWNDNEAFTVALAVKSLLTFAARGSNVELNEDVNRTLSTRSYLFGNQDMAESQDQLIKLAS